MKRVFLSLACFLLSTSTFTPAFADSPTAISDPPIPPQAIETITVSAAPIPVDWSGSAITVINGDTLLDRQITQVFDAMRDVPGVEVSRSGSVGSISDIRIRGAETGQELVLIDGVRANDPAASSSAFNFAHLVTASTDRIEVLRGPQSALWGADALAGVVNIVTVAPEPGFQVRASADYGSFDTKEASALVNMGSDAYGAVVDADWIDTGGSNISRTGNENDGYRDLTVGGRARADLAPNFAVTLAVHHSDERSDGDTSGFVDPVSIPIDSGDFTRFTATYARAEARATFMDGHLETIAGASLTRTESRDYTSAFGEPFDVAFNDFTKGGENKFDVQANYLFAGWAGPQRISVLGETMRDTFSTMRLDLPSADQSQHESNSGIAAEYWATVAQGVYVSLGARHDWNQRFDDSTTWRATVSGQVPETNVRLHASAGTGVKDPDFFELFGFIPSPSFVGNPNLKPEKSFGYDAGVAWKWPGLGLVFDATYFHADLENEIFTDFSVFPETARNMTGKSERKGVELGAHAQLAPGLTLDATYTYLDSKAADGSTEIRRPHNIGSVDLDYRFLDNRAFVSVGADFHGSQRDSEFLNVPPFSAPVTLHSYTLVRVSASYAVTQNVEAFGRIENALDQQYEEVFGYRARGFAAFAGIRVHFD